jgi:hypothetical protein
MDTQLFLLVFLLLSLVATFQMDETPSAVTIQS